jgi:lipopolysaccharide biosynthesis protein
VTTDGAPAAAPPSVPRSVAFYLPQFHPIPENDEWWGEGFTEWVNVRRAMPLFRGHQQPRVPADLGYYDLRDPHTRSAQADLARQHGIGAFCYYHYWFDGRRLLERPLTDMLDSGEPDFPFMLCWANENWTRAWDGGTQDVLMAQHHSVADDLRHFRHLAPIFEDPRYVRIDGRPVFLVYRAGLLDDARQTAETWRHEADRIGVAQPYLCHVESFPTEERDPAAIGFDAAVEFAPQFAYLPHWRRTNRLFRKMAAAGVAPRRLAHHIVDYGSVMNRMLAKPNRDYTWHRTATPGWDNTPRRASGGVILRDSTPELFGAWITSLLRDGAATGSSFVFINAWNEWAEGAYLEPDQEWGRGYLEAHARARAAVTADREFR